MGIKNNFDAKCEYFRRCVNGEYCMKIKRYITKCCNNS